MCESSSESAKIADSGGKGTTTSEQSTIKDCNAHGIAIDFMMTITMHIDISKIIS